jgi:hypothetical protein
MSEEIRPAVSVEDDATRDACAIVASLRSGNMDAYELLAGFYESDAKAQTVLCGALAAFATACLATIDKVSNSVLVTHGVVMPSGDDVLKTVMLKLSEPKAE